MQKIIDQWRFFFGRHGCLTAGLFAVAVLSQGCASLVIAPMAGPVLKNLNRQADLELVCDGAPSYLLLLDSLLVSEPENAGLLAHGHQAAHGRQYPGLAQTRLLTTERSELGRLRHADAKAAAGATGGRQPKERR